MRFYLFNGQSSKYVQDSWLFIITDTLFLIFDFFLIYCLKSGFLKVPLNINSVWIFQAFCDNNNTKKSTKERFTFHLMLMKNKSTPKFVSFGNKNIMEDKFSLCSWYE